MKFSAIAFIFFAFTQHLFAWAQDAKTKCVHQMLKNSIGYARTFGLFDPKDEDRLADIQYESILSATPRPGYEDEYNFTATLDDQLYYGWIKVDFTEDASKNVSCKLPECKKSRLGDLLMIRNAPDEKVILQLKYDCLKNSSSQCGCRN